MRERREGGKKEVKQGCIMFLDSQQPFTALFSGYYQAQGLMCVNSIIYLSILNL